MFPGRKYTWQIWRRWICGLSKRCYKRICIYLYGKIPENDCDLTLATGEQVHLSASAGGAAFPEQGEDFISLCRSADAALYNVKQNGKAAFKMK